MNREQLKNKVLGSLIGFAIGDAMGATTEFMTQEEIVKKYGEVNDIIGGGWLGLTPGEVTDDTQMMTIVAHALIYEGDRFTEACCEGFVEWLDSGPKDVGNTCRTAIWYGRGKTPIEWMRMSKDRQVKSGNLDLGNGAVMRALFPALMGEKNVAVIQGRLTHNNVVSDLCIMNYCYAIRKALYEPQCWDGGSVDLELMNPTGHVKNSVNNAIYWSSKANSFEEAIIGPVNHGGDADTIAALTGGIAGAYFGKDHIPTKWVEKLSPVVMGDLEEMADWLMNRIKG